MTSGALILEVHVSIIRSRRYVLTRFRLPVPEPVRIRALIDTGATDSCFDPSVFARLDLTSNTQIPVLTPGTGNALQFLKQYDVDVELLGLENTGAPLFERVAAVEAPLAAQGIEGLIGRDVLNRCLFIYDGNANTFSLSFGS